MAWLLRKDVILDNCSDIVRATDDNDDDDDDDENWVKSKFSKCSD